MGATSSDVLRSPPPHRLTHHGEPGVVWAHAHTRHGVRTRTVCTRRRARQPPLSPRLKSKHEGCRGGSSQNGTDATLAEPTLPPNQINQIAVIVNVPSSLRTFTT